MPLGKRCSLRVAASFYVGQRRSVAFLPEIRPPLEEILPMDIESRPVLLLVSRTPKWTAFVSERYRTLSPNLRSGVGGLVGRLKCKHNLLAILDPGAVEFVVWW